MPSIGDLSPNTRPPESLIAVHKHYQKLSADALAKDANVLDFHKVRSDAGNAEPFSVKELNKDGLAKAFSEFEGPHVDFSSVGNIRVYEHKDLPGQSLKGTT